MKRKRDIVKAMNLKCWKTYRTYKKMVRKGRLAG
jgi:hypothetical protein